ncbi:prostasin-like [Cydia amplana]|uniref:prostasin-like n=1 Tax=Cydia amplana TaxID=1869771 RepID=UPI002FE52F25
MDYPIAGGEPLSTFTFTDDYDFSKDGIKQALPLESTEAPKDGIGDRSTDPIDNQTNIVTVDPNWNPETAIKVKDNERLPWQVSVFSKQAEPFLRVCGASMVSRTTVISAAHCFWKEGQGLLPASQFAVGAGEVLTYELDDYGSYRQQNDVGSIKVPPTFNGAANNFQYDIAVVHLTWPFYDSSGMRPVCISFDDGLEEEQLRPGNIATTLGVGLLQKGLTELQTLNVPYASPEDCKRSLAKNTLQYFTEDKICAGFKPGTSPVLGEICTRDAGAGLAFYLGNNQDLAKGIAVPFLRGVASRSHPCDAGQRTLYTNVRTHRVFLEENIQGVVEECGKYYPQVGALLTRDVDVRQYVCNCYC